jgi:hypothetical protein
MLQVEQGYGNWPGGTDHPPGHPRYGRGFVAIPATNENINKLANIMATRLPPASNHVYEIIARDVPTKLVFDFDGDDCLPTELFPTRKDFSSQVEAGLTKITAELFGIKLEPASFVGSLRNTHIRRSSAHTWSSITRCLTGAFWLCQATTPHSNMTARATC